ncbi:MAG: hypothetical protein JXC32_10070 [Anaerolineae bacterium]|nr:hypothetical protein [Anaerolineae bacterium]
MNTTARCIARLASLLIVLSLMIPSVALAGEGDDGNPPPGSVDCHPVFDWGDLPSNYCTQANDSPLGPSHSVLDTEINQNPRLGALWDYEADGQPAAMATGDDEHNDDEDGVEVALEAAWHANGSCPITVTVTGADDSSYGIGAWLDWNGDFDFEDVHGGAPEAFAPRCLSAGVHRIELGCPTEPFSDTIYARFRLYDDGCNAGGGYLPTGAVEGGEVEDYVWEFDPTHVTMTALVASAANDWIVGLVLGSVVVGTVGAPALLGRRRRR